MLLWTQALDEGQFTEEARAGRHKGRPDNVAVYLSVVLVGDGLWSELQEFTPLAN